MEMVVFTIEKFENHVASHLSVHMNLLNHCECTLKRMCFVINSKANGSLYHQRSCSQLAYEGNISSMTILTWMYKDSNSTIRLDRKYALYSKFTETANLKPKPQSEEISSFLNGRIYKTLTQCQNDR
eukprot:16161_1